MADKRQQTGTRIIGIDTSLRSTGFGVIEQVGSRIIPVEFGNIRIPQSARLSECLFRISSEIADVAKRTGANAASIEDIFFCKNVRTAITLGEARGAVLSTLESLGIPVYEYAPRKAKQAVTGSGAAEKLQVHKMLMTILGLAELPQEDAGDALALAVCHVHNNSGIKELMPERI
jgi:crossover junction endodeoxyribonuclease RuvC